MATLTYWFIKRSKQSITVVLPNIVPPNVKRYHWPVQHSAESKVFATIRKPDSAFTTLVSAPYYNNEKM